MKKQILLLLVLFLLLSSCGSKSGDGEEKEDGILDGQHRIFVSSIDYDGNLGGLSGADDKCAELAQAAGLKKSYISILSIDDNDDTNNSASGRMALTGEVLKVDDETESTIVASGASKLWGAEEEDLLARVDLDENGDARPGQTPWTGTSASGGGSLNYCNEWTSNTSDYDGDFGNTDEFGAKWIENNFEKCDNQNPIYCISE